jgi:hypothetical protein
MDHGSCSLTSLLHVVYEREHCVEEDSQISADSFVVEGLAA